MLEAESVMVVGAHPDDMELWVGGLVAHLAAKEADVVSVVVASRRKSNEPSLAETREREARQSAEILGIAEPIFLGNYEGSTEYAVLSGQLAGIITGYSPDVILTHFPIDPHFGHALTGMVAFGLYCSHRWEFDLYFFKTSESYSFLPTDTFVGDRAIKYKALAMFASAGFDKIPEADVCIVEEFVRAKKPWNPERIQTPPRVRRLD